MAAKTSPTVYGRLSSRFDCAPLGKLCVDGNGVQTGPFGSQLHEEDYVSVGTPILTVEHLSENRISHSDLPKVSEADRLRLSRYTLQEGDIVFSRVGSVDRRALVRKEEEGWLFSGRCLRVRVDRTRIDPQYLSWFFGFEGFKEHIRRIAVGATMPSINTKILAEVPVYFPPLEEQKAIAAMLGGLDDKIELNRRMNATLEAMARTLFQSWFVDFDPVRAILDGGQAIGLDPATSALFPEHFDHKVGTIVPNGWNRKRWGDIATLEYGKSLRDYRAEGGKYRVFGTNGPIGFHHEALCNSAGIVIGRKGAYRGIHYSRDPFFVIDTAFYLKPKTPFDLKWAYYELLRFDINSMDSGSAIPSTSREDFYGIPVVVPPVQIQDAFGKIVGGWFAKAFGNAQESRTLATLRETILPKLLSGELRVNTDR